MKAIIDTNVILDALAGREPFRIDAENIFAQVSANSFEGCISANSVTDIYYILRKSTKDSVFSRKAIGKLLSLFSVQDTTQADCMNAIASDMADFEDALLAACADRGECDYIVTRNLKDFLESPVKAISPREFLDLLEID